MGMGSCSDGSVHERHVFSQSPLAQQINQPPHDCKEHQAWRLNRTRLATGDDARALGALAKRTFIQLLGEFYEPDDLVAYTDGAYSEETMRAELTDPKRKTVLVFAVEDPSSPCGFVMLCDDTIRPGDDCDACAPGDYLEIKRVYVDTAFHGKGAAHVLMEAVLKVVKEKKRKIVWLGTGVDNVRAQKFYEKLGFAATGERLYQVGPVAHADVVMTLQAT